MDKCDFILSAEGAQRCFHGVEFPAGKQDILNCIEQSGGPEAVIVAANQIPDRVYGSFEELLQYLQPDEQSRT